MRVSRVLRASTLARSGTALSVVAAALALGAPQAAWAQTPPGEDQPPVEEAAGEQVNQSSQPDVVNESSADQGVPSDAIVVTGTILRGAPPVGSNMINVGEERLQSSGATTSNELLATVPQVSNLFNDVPTARLGVAVNNIQVVRPRLRNLEGETSSSTSTLVLFDGHRISPVGVTQNAVDPDIIPPIAIERVEIVTDGGSATYGSDAVGGVINFITRKRFDGVKVTAHYGFADDYYQVDAGGIVGKDWGDGSVFAAYNYQHNDALFGRDRDFIRNVDWLSPNLTQRGRTCDPGNVQIGQNFFALNDAGVPSGTVNSFNACDPGDNTIVPRSTRHGALAGLHQDLADWLTVDLRGFYGERSSKGLGPYTGSTIVTPAQFYYQQVPGQARVNETVFFTLAPVLGRNTAESTSAFQEWGANAEFAANITDNWQLRTLFNYSRSHSDFHIQQLDQTALGQFRQGTTAATAINFYNPGAGANDVANIQRLIDNENVGEAKEALFDARAILDGTLFTLPGGDVKLAVGYEYMHDDFQQRSNGALRIGVIDTLPYNDYSRRINSVFGEVQVPIVGADNRMGGIYSLVVNGSVRHDHFSDFGSTTNPKIGVNYKPISWLGLRGNYNTSFNAPSPNDQLGSLANFTQAFPFTAFPSPTAPPQAASGTVALRGSNPGLLPQEAESYSFGFDLDPPFLEGLHASLNYYNVKFENVISIPTPNTGIFAQFPNNVVVAPNGIPLADVQAFLFGSGATDAAVTFAQVQAGCANPAACTNVYELVDFRQGNYGNLKVEGLDFAVNYRTDTSFGGVDAGISGNYQLKRDSQSGEGAPVIDQLEATNQLLPNGLRLVNNAVSRLQLSASLGADIGNFRAQATLNHSAGFDVVRCDPTTTPVCRPSTTGVPTSGGLPQDRVGDFNVVNLFFKYDVPGDSLLLRDLELTLNVNNVFDEDPPIFRQIGASTPGYANGFTLGRLVQFGVSKKF